MIPTTKVQKRPTARKASSRTSAAAENLSIAGLKNFRHSNNRYGKRFWLLTIFVSVACTAYYDAKLCHIYVQKRTSPQISYIRAPALPFPFIYACARGARNRTLVQSRIPLIKIRNIIEANETHSLSKLIRMHGVTIEWFYDQFLKFFVYTGNMEPTFDLRFLYGYIELLNFLSSPNNPNPIQYIELMRESLYPCESVLSNCTFQGVPFDCCPQNSSLSAMLEDYPCFGINANGTYADHVYQDKSGLENGLSFDTRLDTIHMFDGFASTAGIQLHFSRELSTLTTPTLVVANAIGHIRVKLVKKRLLNRCIDAYTYSPLTINKRLVLDPDLETYMRSFSEPEMYGPSRCELAVILATVRFGCGCLFSYDRTFRPNQSKACTPIHEYSCIRPSLFDSAKIWKSDDGKKLDAVELINRVWKANCLPLCDSWHYETDVGFTVLPETTSGAAGQSVLRNRYIVNFGELEYRSEVEELDLNGYQFVCLLGSNLGIFLGMSVITVMQALALVAVYLMEKHNARVIVPLKTSDKKECIV